MATAAIVDAYSVGRHLPGAFARAGAEVVHVQSTPDFLPGVPPPDLSPYAANVVHTTPEQTAARLGELGVVCVVPGQETGVPLADLLSERLGLPGNGSALSRARRDKYDMIETLRSAGLHCARQLKSHDVDELVAWADSNGYPVVVKPLSSASTDGVSICHDAVQLRKASEALLGTLDIFQSRNSEVLVQSYLDGVEYVVDAVCAGGRPHICGVWRYDKTDVGTTRIYDREILLAPRDEPVAALVGYLCGVLEALGIGFGAAHAEIMMTSSGPALVEIGARLNGSMDPGFHDVCLDGNQADLLARSYTRPREPAPSHPGVTVYRKRCEALLCNTQSRQDGIVDAIDEDVLAQIRDLDTVYGVLPRVGVGGRIRPTTDLLSSPLRVFLAGERADQVMADYHRVLALKDKVYRLKDLT